MTDQHNDLKEVVKAAIAELFEEKKDKGTLTPEQAAEVLQVNINKVYELCHHPTFPALNIGRKWIIHREAMLQWIIDEAERQKQDQRNKMHRMFQQSKTGVI